MKLVWSPETASKAYIDTVKFVSNVFVLDRSSDEMLFMNSIGFFFFFQCFNEIDLVLGFVCSVIFIKNQAWQSLFLPWLPVGTQTSSLRHGHKVELW
jgi:hypothetical protein